MRELKDVYVCSKLVATLESGVEIYKAYYGEIKVMAFCYKSFEEAVDAISLVKTRCYSNALSYFGLYTEGGKWYAIFERFSYTLEQAIELSAEQARKVIRDIFHGSKLLNAKTNCDGVFHLRNVSIIDDGDGYLTAKLMGMSSAGIDQKGSVSEAKRLQILKLNSLKKILKHCFRGTQPALDHLLCELSSKSSYWYYCYGKDDSIILYFGIAREVLFFVTKVADVMQTLDGIHLSLNPRNYDTYKDFRLHLQGIYSKQWNHEFS